MSQDKERRHVGGDRVSINTLVEIGAGAGGSAAFEAESVDLTTAGMHLRTAYLPETGEPLVCRFDANGKEVVVHGEVVWRNEDAYGGDFGIRFLEIDPESLAGLREIAGETCLTAPGAPPESESPADQVHRGTRVRLHIEGLGSPMKARVRDATQAEVLVGSNLEFLRVGRSVDLENVDAQADRQARIERVSIEVEPGTHVPQLIVALRYLDAPQEPVVNHIAETPIPGDEDEREPEAKFASQEAKSGAEDGELDDGLTDEEEEDDEDDGPSRSAAIWSKVKKVGPVLTAVGAHARGLGGRAKSVVSEAVEKRRLNKELQEETKRRPRRTTSAPPKSTLRGAKSQSASDTSDSDDTNVNLPLNRKLTKRTIAIGLVTLLLVIVGVGYAASPWDSKDSEVVAASSAEATSPEQLPIPAENAAAANTPPPTEGALVAKVPLFGPTPMTTSMLVAPPAVVPVDGTATPPPDDEGAVAEADSEDEGSEGGDEGEDNASRSDDDEESAAPRRRTASKSFGRGKVRNPITMTLKMNKKIRSLKGSTSSDGFKVTVVGARSKEPAAGLRRRDSRIASARISNQKNSAELAIRFKKDMPPFSVRANGSTLQIRIGGGKKTAKAGERKTNSKSKRRSRSKR